MFARHSGTKGTIWFGSLCIVFVLAFIQEITYPHIAEATLLESPKVVSGQKELTSAVLNLPVLSNVLPDNGKTAPPSTNQAKDSRTFLTLDSTPSAEKTSGQGLLPDLQVKTPSISVDMPLVNVDVPSAKAEVSTDRIPLVSVNLPAAKVDTPIVQVKTPAVQVEVPLTPIPAPQIKVVTPRVQVKTPVTDIPVPSSSKSNLPLIERGKASDVSVKLVPTANQWKDVSTRAPDPSAALPRLNRGLSLPVPTKVNAPIGPQKAAKNQTGTSKATPIRTDPVNAWFSAPLILYTGNGSTGGGASFVTGSSSLFGSLGYLFPDILLPPPKINNQNYEHSRLFGANQWSKPPPAQPPRYLLLTRR